MQKPELALSIKQPWAWLISQGLKDIENRRWSTTFRGRIYVHAGKSWDAFRPWDWEDVENKLSVQSAAQFREWRQTHIHQDGSLSAIVGEVAIVDCVKSSASPWFEGPYGFVLADPVAYSEVIPCKGKLGFFKPEVMEAT